MCSVPRFWEKVYAGVQEKIAQETGLKKAMMLDAIKVGKIHNICLLYTSSIQRYGHCTISKCPEIHIKAFGLVLRKDSYVFFLLHS